MAEDAGWQKQKMSAGRFTLTGYAKGLQRAGRELFVYIESDGYAWRSRWALSPDPTPRDPQGLRLALRDPRPRVLYLARPCQYARDAWQGCEPIYWSSHRYGETVVAALDQAIDQVKDRVGASAISLLGISGGGVIAALLAARRDDVTQLTTIAANLDHAAWTEHHEVSPLVGSLNPADFAERLGPIPQRHFVGADDDVVPPAIVESYIARMSDRSKTELIVMPDFDHDCCWIEAWPSLMAR